MLDDGCYVCLDCINLSVKNMIEKHTQDNQPPRCPCYGDTEKTHGNFTMSDAKQFDALLKNKLKAPLSQAVDEMYRKSDFVANSQGPAWKCMHCNELSAKKFSDVVLRCEACHEKTCVICETRILRGDEDHALAHETKCKGIPELQNVTNEWRAIVERGSMSPSDIAKVAELLSTSTLLRAAPKCPSCGVHFFKSETWQCFHIECSCGTHFCFCCEGILNLNEVDYLELSAGGNKAICSEVYKRDLDFVEHTANRPDRPRAAVLPALDVELLSRPGRPENKTLSYYHYQAKGCPQYPHELPSFFGGRRESDEQPEEQPDEQLEEQPDEQLEEQPDEQPKKQPKKEPEHILVRARAGGALEDFLESKLDHSTKRKVIAKMTDRLGVFDSWDKNPFDTAYDLFVKYRRSFYKGESE
jgi:hypothetical protein